MNLSEIKTTPLSRKNRMRVGRGSGSGKGATSGRGNKGQRARSGASLPIVFEGGTMPLYRRLPKRGFKNARFGKNWVGVNTGQLNVLAPGTEVNFDTLRSNGIVSVKNGLIYNWKLLAKGELKVENLMIKAHRVSKKAQEIVEQAKGKIEIVEIKRQEKSRRRKP